MYILQLVETTCEQSSRRRVQRLARKSEARSLQSAQTLSRRHVAATVAGCEVLEDGPDHPDVASLDALADVIQEALAFLGCDATLRQHSDSVGDPRGHLLRVNLEEVKQHTRRVGKAALGETVHHARHDTLDK